jgi:hypothetical protein
MIREIIETIWAREAPRSVEQVGHEQATEATTAGLGEESSEDPEATA